MDAIEIRILDPDAADLLARRLVNDVNGAGIAAEARLARRAADAGEKGVIEAIGTVLVTLLQAQAVDAVVAFVRGLLSGDGATEGGQPRVIEMTLPDGTAFKLEGPMTREEFASVRDRLLRLAEGPGRGTA